MNGGWWRVSSRGGAYLAAANFMGRAVSLGANFVHSLFSYEMLLLYGAHLDSHILLFFQAVFMIPVALLGTLLFIGIEREWFNMVLYPTLMLLFLILLRYGAETALLIIHWDEHGLERAPSVVFYSCVDLFFIALLLFYVYFSLAARPSSHSYEHAPHLLEGALLTKKGAKRDPESVHLITSLGKDKKKKKPPAAPPPEEGGEPQPPSRPPPSPKFDYALRRNIAHLPVDQRALVDQLDMQRQRNSQILLNAQEEEVEPEKDKSLSTEARVKTQSLKVYETEPKRRSLLFETDLDGDESNDGGREVPPMELSPLHSEEVKVEVTSPSEGEKEKEEEEESEWEYEYETDDEADEAKQEVPPPEESVEKGVEAPPPTSPATSSKSFKTTAV